MTVIISHSHMEHQPFVDDLPIGHRHFPAMFSDPPEAENPPTSKALEKSMIFPVQDFLYQITR